MNDCEIYCYRDFVVDTPSRVVVNVFQHLRKRIAFYRVILLNESLIPKTCDSTSLEPMFKDRSCCPPSLLFTSVKTTSIKVIYGGSLIFIWVVYQIGLNILSCLKLPLECYIYYSKKKKPSTPIAPSYSGG